MKDRKAAKIKAKKESALIKRLASQRERRRILKAAKRRGK